MQIFECNTDAVVAPRVYRNRPHSFAFDSPRPEPPCDVIYLIDEDPQLREEIATCFAALGTKVTAFQSGTDYLNFPGQESAACLVLNTHLPDISGFELQRRLAPKGNPPVIFISDHNDIASIVKAMKDGAIEFLTKPVDLRALITAVHEAFIQDRKRRRRQAEIAELQERFSLLTPREREVLPLVVGGLLNKQAASFLGISEVTLQIHRSQIMRKTRAESLAELVRMTIKLRIPHWCEKQTRNSAERKVTPIDIRNVSDAFQRRSAKLSDKIQSYRANSV
jgi:FixJ family two-component response regulator